MIAPNFLPDDLGEWLGAISIVLGAAAAVIVGLVRAGRYAQTCEDSVKEIKKEIDDHNLRHGERLGAVEDRCAKAESELRVRSENSIRDEGVHTSNSAEMIRIRSSIDGLTSELRTLSRDLAARDNGFVQRLTRVETLSGLEPTK